jgi:hypothetical protein
MSITVQELRQHFHRGRALPYTWPGSYPKIFICNDGGVLCPDCLTKNRVQVFRSTHEGQRDGWALEGVDVNWEDPALNCDHCGKRIESAWAEDETEANHG